MNEQNPITNLNIDKDLSVGRNIAVGGRINVRGNVEVNHNLKVKGYVEAQGIRSPNKGVFPSPEMLMSTYPKPREGWYAYAKTTPTGSEEAYYMYETKMLSSGGWGWQLTGVILGALNTEAVEEQLSGIVGRLGGIDGRLNGIDDSIENQQETIEDHYTRILALEEDVSSLPELIAATEAARDGATSAAGTAQIAATAANGAATSAATAATAANNAASAAKEIVDSFKAETKNVDSGTVIADIYNNQCIIVETPTNKLTIKKIELGNIPLGEASVIFQMDSHDELSLVLGEESAEFTEYYTFVKGAKFITETRTIADLGANTMYELKFKCFGEYESRNVLMIEIHKLVKYE